MRIHLKIGKKDADLVYWIESLPCGCFSHYAVLILQAEVRKKIAVIPVYEQEGISNKTKEVAIYVNDKQVISMIEGLPKGTRAKYIKKIVRKHINANFRKNSQRQDEKQIGEKKPVLPEKISTPQSQTDVVNKNASEEKSAEVNEFRARMMKMANR